MQHCSTYCGKQSIYVQVDPHIPCLCCSEVNCISFLLGPWKQRLSLAYLLISSGVFSAHSISVMLLFKIFISKENFLTEVIYVSGYVCHILLYISAESTKGKKCRTRKKRHPSIQQKSSSNYKRGPQIRKKGKVSIFIVCFMYWLKSLLYIYS